MVFLIVLITAWSIVMLPQARRARWMHPWMSVRRYRTSMKLVAPRTRYEVRRASFRPDEPTQRVLTRRREVAVFLASAACAAALAGLTSDARAAWPVCGLFTALLLMYAASILESDRRKIQRRVTARRRAREPAPGSKPEHEYAEAV